MACADRCRVQVWCEDRRQEHFARKILENYGFHRRNVYFSLAPRGKGAASAWVIAKYPEVVKKHQSTRNQANLGFLVFVDGNSDGLPSRKSRLCGHPDQRAAPDRIAIWIPTWSIETWILWLCGDTTLGEHTSYKNQKNDGDYKDLVKIAVDAWGKPAHPSEPEQLPSLTAARLELARLPGAK